MTLTVAEAEGRMAELVEQAVAGAEVVIASTRPNGAAVKLTPLVQAGTGPSRLQRDPALIGSTKTLDRAALLTPLPPEEWGGSPSDACWPQDD
jgi:antitoxin (DNA-binding transcriptional repressor) of toxin-antitoxin stability system